MTGRRIGAYVLPGDPVWLERTLPQYYPLIDDLVVPVPADGLSWLGKELPLDEVLGIIRALDTRGIARYVSGEWVDTAQPLRADTAQRQAAVDALVDVDWVLQLDNDEYLPAPERLAEALDAADAAGVGILDWPMRVLYRRTRRHVYEVVGASGQPIYEYPGPIAVRAGTRLREARKAEGAFLRLVVRGDASSEQVRRAPEPGEHRLELLSADDAILHNSWARSPRAIARKIASSGHARDTSLTRYYWVHWRPAPVLWRVMRDFHPLFGGLWPRLARRPNSGVFGD